MAVDVHERLGRWVQAGLITSEQAAAIDDLEARESGAGQRTVALAAEAVGYLGAALALIAAGLVASRYWERIETWGRLTLLVTLGMATYAAGWWIRHSDEPAIDRLVSVLWAGTAVATAFTAGILGDDVLGLEEAWLGVLIGGSVTVVGGALYLARRRSLQQIALAAGVVATGMSALAAPDADVDLLAFGGVLFALGLAWFLLAAGGWIEPARTGQVLGLIGMGYGAQIATFGSQRTVALTVALVATFAALAAGALGRSTLLLGAGVLGAFVFVPQLVNHLFGDSLGAPFVLFVTGMVLIGVAVGSVRIRQEIRTEVLT